MALHYREPDIPQTAAEREIAERFRLRLPALNRTVFPDPTQIVTLVEWRHDERMNYYWIEIGKFRRFFAQLLLDPNTYDIKREGMRRILEDPY